MFLVFFSTISVLSSSKYMQKIAQKECRKSLGLLDSFLSLSEYPMKKQICDLTMQVERDIFVHWRPKTATSP